MLLQREERSELGGERGCGDPPNHTASTGGEPTALLSATLQPWGGFGTWGWAVLGSKGLGVSVGLQSREGEWGIEGHCGGMCVCVCTHVGVCAVCAGELTCLFSSGCTRACLCAHEWMSHGCSSPGTHRAPQGHPHPHAVPPSQQCPSPGAAMSTGMLVVLSPPQPSLPVPLLPHSPGGAEPGAAAEHPRPLLSPSLHPIRRCAEPPALLSLL